MNRRLLKTQGSKGSFQLARWFVLGMAIFIGLYLLIGNGIVDAAANSGKVVVTAVSNPPGSNRVKYGVRDQRGRDAARNDTLQEPWQVLSLLNGNGSTVRMQSYRPNSRGYMFHARSGSRPVEFFYPCRGKGSFILAWSAGSQGGCSPPGFLVGSTRIQTANSLDSNTTTIAAAPKDLLKSQASFGDLLRDFTSRVKIEYCSYVEEGGGAWSMKSAIAGLADPCQHAKRQCLDKTSGGNGCFVASAGEWQLANKDLVFSLDCADNRSFKVTQSGQVVFASLVLQVEEIARQIGGGACVGNVFPAGDMVVAPATDQMTIVQIRDLEGRVVVDALKGSVLVQAAETPQAAPFRLEEGSTYRGGGYDGRYYGGGLSQSDRAEVWSTPTIQEILTTDNPVSPSEEISPEIAREMTTQQQAFRDALREVQP